jgi:hypothetical protein
MGIARLRITGELLREFFKFPNGTELWTDGLEDQIEINISHPDIPSGIERALIEPKFERIDVRLVDWGLP